MSDARSELWLVSRETCLQCRAFQGKWGNRSVEPFCQGELKLKKSRPICEGLGVVIEAPRYKQKRRTKEPRDTILLELFAI